jgi:hypothetical protein
MFLCAHVNNTEEQYDVIFQKIEKNQQISYLMIVFLFCFFDCIIVFFIHSSSIDSLSKEQLKRSIKLENITYNIMFFIIFFLVNVSLLYIVLFSVSGILYKIGISHKMIFFITVLCVIIRLHSWITSSVFQILGILNPNQEYIELFGTPKNIAECLAITTNKTTRIRSKYNQILAKIRSKVYSIMFFNSGKITYAKLFSHRLYNSKQKTFSDKLYSTKRRAFRSVPPNRSPFPNFIMYLFRLLIIPHALTALLNQGGAENVILRSIIYVLLTGIRLFYFMKLILFLISKNNI